jgi:hypothetical protein
VTNLETLAWYLLAKIEAYPTWALPKGLLQAFPKVLHQVTLFTISKTLDFAESIFAFDKHIRLLLKVFNLFSFAK